MPTWSIVPSRFWKAQVAYLARHFRVVTFDGRGSGRVRPAGGGGGVHQRGVRRRHRRGDGRRRRRPGRPGLALVRGDLVGARRGRPPRAGARACSRSRRPAGSRSPSASGELVAWDAPTTTHARAGRSTTGTTGWRATTTTSCGSSSARCSTSRTRPSRSRTQSAGAARSRPQTLVDTTAGTAGLRRRGLHRHRAAVRAGPVPGDGAARHRRPGPPDAIGERLPSSPAARSILRRGRRPRPARPRPGAGQPARSARSSSGSAPPRSTRDAPGRGPPRRPSGRSTSPRRSASGTPGATLAIAEELRALHPDLRDRLAGPGPGHPGARRAAASGSTRRRA